MIVNHRSMFELSPVFGDDTPVLTTGFFSVFVVVLLFPVFDPVFVLLPVDEEFFFHCAVKV